MSNRLRPRGKPCLRSLRGTLMVVAGVVASVTAPATAAYADHLKPLGWYAEQGAAPTTVQFGDVAASGGTVLAVGRDGDEATGTAAMYRRVGDTWQAETLPTLPAPSVLTDVAVDVTADGSREWAIGEAAGEPVVLQRVDGAWRPQTLALDDGVGLKSVAVEGSKALVGDSAGTIHVFSGAGVTTQKPLAAGAINDIALTAEGTGVAVADSAEELPGPFPVFGERSVRIYSLSPDSEPMPDYQAEAATAGTDMKAVAAAANGGAVALDDADGTQATWHLMDDGHWFQDAVVSGATLTGVASLRLSDTDVRETLVGSVGTEGAIWQRDRYKGHDFAWQRQTLAAGTKPLASVTLTGAESGFAVGGDGTVLRLWRPPDPDAHAAAEQAAYEEAERQRLEEEARLAEEERLYQEQLAAEQAAAEQAAAEQAAAEQAAAEQAAAEQAAAEQAAAAEPTAEPSAPPPPPPVEQDEIDMNGVVIDDSTESAPTRTRQRLLKNVRAVRRGRKLIVSFRLTAKARVALTAKRGRRVIAKTRMRTLRKGRRRIVLRFRGRPPSSLKVVVRRVAGARDTR